MARYDAGKSGSGTRGGGSAFLYYFDQAIDGFADGGIGVVVGDESIVRIEEGDFDGLFVFFECIPQRKFLFAVGLASQTLDVVAVNGVLETLLGSNRHYGTARLTFF